MGKQAQPKMAGIVSDLVHPKAMPTALVLPRSRGIGKAILIHPTHFPVRNGSAVEVSQ